ncbi:hypothetical protein NSS94_01320 [Paenibacillus sp. FSL L8-0644]|nr:hypothetical protein [Paenibacillus polymyxa]MDY8096063.1 hypothetical protein [Paenibacillus polymyxa]
MQKKHQALWGPYKQARNVDIFNGHEITNLPVSRNYINNLLEVYSDDVLP